MNFTRWSSRDLASVALTLVLVVCAFMLGSLGREMPCHQHQAFVVDERACVPANAVVPAR